MALKKPQVTQVKTDISSITYYIRSVKKFGKTTLFRDVIMAKFGDPTKGLLVGVGEEMGYSLLDNLNATQAESWADLDDLRKWLITQKGKEHDIRMVAFDVVDELIPLAEAEIIRLSIRETGKPCKTFNSAFGGYAEPRKRLMKLLKEYFGSLKKAGITPVAIAHTKVKSIKEKGEDGEGYNQLTSNLSNDYEGIFGDIFDCVLTGYIDRNVEDGQVTSETRKLYFRGTSFVDAGCRFGFDTVPEYIVFDKPNMAKEFIEVLEEGLRKSRTTNKLTVEEFKTQQAEEVAKREEESKEYIEEVAKEVEKEEVQEETSSEPEVNKEDLAKAVVSKFKTATTEKKSKVKEILNGKQVLKADIETLQKALEVLEQ